MAPTRRFFAGLVLAALGIVLARPGLALTDQEELVEKSRITFDTLISSPDFRQLPDYVKQAKGIIVFPALLKGGFIIGAEGGSGVFLVRKEGGGWSSPAFYTLVAGSVGLQIGGQVSEVIFTVMSQKAVEAILANQMKFGGDMSIAAGPIGAGLEAATTTNLDADLYSFAKAAGLFGGVSFEGAGILKRDEWNEGYYGAGATPHAILIENKFSNPGAEPLLKALAPY